MVNIDEFVLTENRLLLFAGCVFFAKFEDDIGIRLSNQNLSMDRVAERNISPLTDTLKNARSSGEKMDVKNLFSFFRGSNLYAVITNN